jgi:hypothetical protein
MKLYRYSNNRSEGQKYPSICSTQDPNIDVYLHEYDVTKETKCGVWIEIDYRTRRKFVNTNCVKQFAYKSLEDAKQNFISRKHRQIRILESQVRTSKVSLAAIESDFTLKPSYYFPLE